MNFLKIREIHRSISSRLNQSNFSFHNYLLSTDNMTVKSLNAKTKTDISIFINLRYLRLKLLEKKFIITSQNNIPCYVISEVSLKRFYFALFVDGLTLKTEIGVYRFLHSLSSCLCHT